MESGKILKNTIILTLSGVIAKTVDFSFRAWYSGILGKEAMGIFSLCMSAFGILLSFSSAGLGAAVSRLVSLRLSHGEESGVRKIMRCAIGTVLVLGTLSIVIVLINADAIAKKYLNNSRCAAPLCRYLPSIIFMGISYCTKGYFYARRSVLIPASSEFIEQITKVSTISLLLNRSKDFGKTAQCCAVFSGLSIGEGASCLYLLLWYFSEIRKTSALKTAAARTHESILSSLLSLSVPISLSSVSTSFLRAAEDVLTIRGFCLFGMSAASAMGRFGLIHGMVMPLLIFPLTLISSFMALLVPEISRAKENGNLCSVVKKTYSVSYFCGIVIFAVFFVFSNEISQKVYATSECAPYIKVMCVLCPIMILDSIGTGILSGLGLQIKLLFYSLLDGALRIGIVYFALPRFGTFAFIATIFISNLLTFSLTFSAVNRKCGKTLFRDVIFRPLGIFKKSRGKISLWRFRL